VRVLALALVLVNVIVNVLVNVSARQASPRHECRGY